jgi:hypothetical protein
MKQVVNDFLRRALSRPKPPRATYPHGWVTPALAQSAGLNAALASGGTSCQPSPAAANGPPGADLRIKAADAHGTRGEGKRAGDAGC